VKNAFCLIVSTLVAAVAVAQEPAAKPAPAAQTKPSNEVKGRRMGLAQPLVMEKDREVYGGEVKVKEEAKLENILKDPKAFEGKTLRVTGTIDSVCQKKGCFIFLKDGTAKTQVKFKDYSFFLPLDCAGRSVVVEAKPQVKVLTEKWRRHYAEDLGKSKDEIEQIKGDETQVMLEAVAVEIGPPAPSKEASKDAPKAQSKPAVKKEE
jgi:hypothetical protein